ncbi:MAG: nitroreductase family protein [Solobacterium sp.]|nr:nitroreductase family protein [Solobacterium sp.]
MSSVLEIINTRSSIRKYSDKPLPEDVCKTLIEAGLKAPTAANKQEIHITVVARDNPVQQEIQNDLNPNAENSFFFNAPVTFYLSGPDTFKWSAVDAGIAVENIHLAAADMGLGSVILGCMEKVLNGEKKAEYAKKLALPEGNSYFVAIAIGYPETTKEPHACDFAKNVTIL